MKACEVRDMDSWVLPEGHVINQISQPIIEWRWAREKAEIEARGCLRSVTRSKETTIRLTTKKNLQETRCQTGTAVLAVIRVAAMSEVEVKERKERAFDDALTRPCRC